MMLDRTKQEQRTANRHRAKYTRKTNGKLKSKTNMMASPFWEQDKCLMQGGRQKIIKASVNIYLD